MSEGANITETKLRAALGDDIVAVSHSRGELTVTVPAARIVDVCTRLRDDEDLAYDLLSDLCAADYPEREKRFDINYHAYSLSKGHSVRIKIRVGEGEPVPTVTGVWPGANWYEREAYDMLGVEFEGHPDLRRILMWDEFEGHPLRKDFPLTTEPIPFRHGRPMET
ncbi:MAG: NADH-quinone oxidoreductase subunit C [Armatimonadota bacterium]|jgi:NADH-quinone oxidoreductase subunit C